MHYCNHNLYVLTGVTSGLYFFKLELTENIFKLFVNFCVVAKFKKNKFYFVTYILVYIYRPELNREFKIDYESVLYQDLISE